MTRPDRIRFIRQFTFTLPGGTLVASAEITPSAADVAPMQDGPGPTQRRRRCGDDYSAIPDVTVSTCGGTVVAEDLDARGRVTAARFFGENGIATAVVDITYGSNDGVARVRWRALGALPEVAITFFCDDSGREIASETHVAGALAERIRHVYRDNREGDWIERRTYRAAGEGEMSEVAVTVREIVYR